MLSLSAKIDEYYSFQDSGATISANLLVHEIANDFLQSLYPLSPPNKKTPKFLVHYTSLDTLFSMLDRSRPDSLRLYDTVHSNDSTEGTFFRQHLKFSLPTVYSKISSLIKNSDPGYAYITSFVRAYKTSDTDELVYWLAYGRNGYGCSIAIPVSDFSLNLPVLTILYGESAVKAIAKQVITFYNSLPSDLQAHLSTSALPKLFHSLPYCHKPRSFSYESECRIILSPLDPKCEPLYQSRFSPTGIPTVRHYVEYPKLRLAGIFFTGTVITLGPSIPFRDNVASAIRSLLDHHNLSGPTVVCSKIPYRPSSA